MNPQGNNMDEILPGLFLGNLVAAESLPILQSNSITHVLSLTSNRPHVPAAASVTHRHFGIHDSTAQNLLAVLGLCIEFLEEVLAGGGVSGNRVLVHCYLGKSRSGGVVVAYVMKHHNMTLKQAHEYVKAKRPIVHPNRAFRSQLELWGSCGYNVDVLGGEEVLDFGFGGDAAEGRRRESKVRAKSVSSSMVAASANGEWVVVHMEHEMRVCFEQCLSEVGIKRKRRGKREDAISV